MLKKFVVAAGIAIASATLAQAEVIDVSTVKCSDLASMNNDEGSYLMIWLHGYYGGKAGDTTIDLAGFEESGKLIGEKCAANPELGLMTAINQLDAGE